MPKCIYCQTDNTDPSIEHVIAEALGGCLKLPADAVCKPCNNRVLGDEIDVPVRNDLTPILVAHGILGKSGVAPTMTVTHNHPTEGARRYRVSESEVTSAEKRKLLSRIGSVYEFRASSPDELEKIRAEIAAKNPGKQVVLSVVEERPLEIPLDHLHAPDFTAQHWSRWAAKTCLNLIAYAWGPDAARLPDFEALRAHVMSRSALRPHGLSVGGCGPDTVTADETPPQHQLELMSASGRIFVKMIAFEFCGFQYEGDAPSLEPVTRRIVLDALNATVASDERA